MTKKVDRAATGRRKLTVRELVEGELDLIVGGTGKTPEGAGEAATWSKRSGRPDGGT